MLVILMTSVILVMALMGFFFLFFFYHSFFSKEGSYECGFDSWGMKKTKFSLQFFFLVVLFLIFDIEIIFIFPLMENIINMTFSVMNISFFFFLFLFLTTIWEWFVGLMEWM